MILYICMLLCIIKALLLHYYKGSMTNPLVILIKKASKNLKIRNTLCVFTCIMHATCFTYKKEVFVPAFKLCPAMSSVYTLAHTEYHYATVFHFILH